MSRVLTSCWLPDRVAVEIDLEEEARTRFEAAMGPIQTPPVPGRGDIVRHAYSSIPRIIADELNDLERRAGETLTVFPPDEMWPPLAADPESGSDAKPITMAEAITDALHLAAMKSSHGLNIPAHRVVNRLGVLSGKHHFPGTNLMQELLESEGLKIESDQIVDFKDFFWDPMDHLNFDEQGEQL